MSEKKFDKVKYDMEYMKKNKVHRTFTINKKEDELLDELSKKFGVQKITVLRTGLKEMCKKYGVEYCEK